MPAEDIKTHLTSTHDFYAILDLPPGLPVAQKDLDRAWRRTALKYHPDKVGPNDVAAREKFHLAQIGYDLLSDPASRAIYDNARLARERKKRDNEVLEGRRREMVEELEKREKAGFGGPNHVVGGVKRGRDGGEEDEEERLQRELRRLTEEGKRKRMEREEMLRKELEAEREKEKMEAEQQKGPGGSVLNGDCDSAYDAAARGVSEIDRTVKVRWALRGDGANITADKVTSMFSRFGKVDSADLLSAKMMKLSSSKKKQMGIVCMVQFASVVGAHAAVEDFSKQAEPEWRLFDSVLWASGAAPDFIGDESRNTKPEAEGPSASMRPADASSRNGSKNPFAFLQRSNGSAIGGRSPGQNDGGPQGKPTFASFSGTGVDAPSMPTFAKAPGVSGPSLEEMTMIRLKEAEKRRLAAEIQRQDDEEDAAEANRT